MADPFDVLAKLVLRHDNLTSALAQGFTEHARLLLASLEKCARQGCKEAATVRHQVLGMKCCDHCAAHLITKARKNIAKDADLDLNLLRGMVSTEDMWVDIPNAIAIRRAQDLVTFTDHNLEPDMPERGSPEWQ
jgi:hypothetical protein